MKTTVQEPALLNFRDVARLTGLSTTWVKTEAGRLALPRPVRIGKNVRWRRADIEKWIELGCPSREEFEQETSR